MRSVDPFHIRCAGVLGLGRSGRAAAERLLELGARVWATDRRSAAELDLAAWSQQPGLELELACEATVLPAECELLIVSPGVAPDHPVIRAARSRGVPVWGELELAFRLAPGPVVAITGTNGKSTTTAMTGHLLEACGWRVEVCGNIGRPFAAAVPGSADRVFVVEVSSFQLETVETFAPRAAAFLNLTPDHLDRHGSIEEYAALKRRIFRRQSAADFAILSADDPWSAGTQVASRRLEFSTRRAVRDGCALLEESCVEFEAGRACGPLFEAADVKIPGRHHLENAMAATLLARAMGMPADRVAPALRAFRGLPHRMELVAEAGGVSYIDDSKGTNLAATLKAIEGFPDGTVHLILGGRNKGADFRELRSAVARKADRVYLIGEAARELEAALAGTVGIELSGVLERAVAAAARAARPGQVVLLSPACASFDQFRDYVERGERFARVVRAELGGEVG